jgi:hypothetical protein
MSMDWAGRWLEDNRKFLFLLILPLFIWNIDYHSTNEHFTLCLFKNITGKDCYGCGVLRGISAALHLHFQMAVHLNKLNLVTIPLLSFIYLKELWKARSSALLRHAARPAGM